ncbi:glycosyltransferase family 2 protein [bacterium]|nr:glycosyltransferase family 2 protein [bacterium]
MTPRGTAVIVTYNSAGSIDDCLRSLAGTVDAGIFKVIVVDNASGDGTADLIERKYPWVELIRNPVNAGFAAGNNLALIHLVGDYCFFLNPDTRVGAGCSKGLMEFLDDHDDAGCVGPAIVDETGKKTLSYFAFTGFITSVWMAIGLQRIFPLNRTDEKFELRRKPSKKVVRVDRLLGAAMMIRNEVLAKVKGFDERFFLYSEEEDFCRQIQNAGWKIYYTPRNFIIHNGGESSSQDTVLAIAATNWSRYLLLRKHCSRFKAELSRIIWILTLVIRFLFSIPRSNKRKGYILSIKSLLKPGYFDKKLRPDRIINGEAKS